MVTIYNYEVRHFFEGQKAITGWKQVLAPHPHGLFVQVLQDARRMKVVAASGTTGLASGVQQQAVHGQTFCRPKTAHQCLHVRSAAADDAPLRAPMCPGLGSKVSSG
ncbi:unnamed protein product [Tilletia controversa]|nr:unnamed protein product [Tilletia controversa]